MYKKLKKDSDSLLKIQAAIRCKKKEVVFLTEEWLWLEGKELDDASDATYIRKDKAERELRDLEIAEKETTNRIKKHAHA